MQLLCGRCRARMLQWLQATREVVLRQQSLALLLLQRARTRRFCWRASLLASCKDTSKHGRPPAGAIALPASPPDLPAMLAGSILHSASLAADSRRFLFGKRAIAQRRCSAQPSGLPHARTPRHVPPPQRARPSSPRTPPREEVLLPSTLGVASRGAPRQPRRAPASYTKRWC